MNARCMKAAKSNVWLGTIFRSATCAQRIGFANLEKFLENWRTFRYSGTVYYLWIDLTEQQSWAALRRAANTKFLICSTNSPILIHVTHSRSEVRHNLVMCEPRVPIMMWTKSGCGFSQITRMLLTHLTFAGKPKATISVDV